MNLYLVGGGSPSGAGGLAHIARAGGAADATRLKIHLCTWSGRGGGNTRDIARGLRIYQTAQSNAGGTARDMRAIGSRAYDRTLRVLLSYHYYKGEDLDALLGACFPPELELDVFADSGAWSAFSVGEPVDEGAYVAWVERWKHRFTAVAGPDVIGDAAKTEAATVRMITRGLGLPVLPVFHVGEDWAFLDRYAAMSDYLAFGGMVPFTRERDLLTRWCRKAFARLPEGKKVHGFGMTTWPILLAFPWFSVDSSSWTSAFRYATLQLFDARRGRMVDVDMRSKRALLAAAPLLATYGLGPGDVQAKSYDRDLVCAVSVAAWQRAEAWLSARRAGGPHTYLAAGAHPAGPNATQGAGDLRSLAAGAERIYLAAGQPVGATTNMGYLSRMARGQTLGNPRPGRGKPARAAKSKKEPT